MKRLLPALASFFVIAIVFSSASLAWFSQLMDIRLPTSFGSTKASYFAGGDGSRENPYQISSRVHLYNVAWLQYLGYFNLNADFNNGRAQSFFELTSSVDMRGLAIPPIGTEEYPFLGSFNGGGNVITDLTVSNAGSDLTERPSNAVFSGGLLQTTTGSAAISVVGLFGVTGDYNSFIADHYADITVKETLTEGASVAATELYRGAMQISDFYVSDLHVNSAAPSTLVGLIAGFVSSTVKNTGVYLCDMTLAANATGLNSEYGSVVSRYSIVGDYDSSLVSWEEKPVDFGGEGDSGWGNSIDIRTLARRLNYIITAEYKADSSCMTSSNNHSYTISGTDECQFHANLKITFPNTKVPTDYQFKWDGLKAAKDNNNNDVEVPYAICDLMENTYLPIKVAIDDKNETTEVTFKGGSRSWNSNPSYNSNKSEAADVSNTGFIVGGSGSNAICVRLQPLDSSTTISGAFTDGLRAGTYTDANLQLSTSTGSGFQKIKDQVNKDNASLPSSTVDSGSLLVYDRIRDSFSNFLGANGMVYGMRFSAVDRYFITKNDADVKTAIGGVEYFQRAINFNLQSAGVITFIAGSYQSGSVQSAPAVYKVSKNASGAITGVQKVEKVYTETATGRNITVYTASDTTYDTAGYTKVYDRTWYASLTARDAYYIEIPVSETGDYAIAYDTSATGSSASAYLMYLDIGANGGGESELPGTQACPYSITTVDFVSAATGSTLAVPGADAGTPYFPHYKDVTFRISGAGSGAAQIYWRRDEYDPALLPTSESVQIATTVRYTALSVTVTPTPAELATEDESLRSSG